MTMNVAYLDCFAGLSGDMFLGALLGAGVNRAVLNQAVGALGLNASLEVETVDRSGISSVRVVVFEGDRPAEQNTAPNSAPQEQAARSSILSRHPETQHLHKTGVPHSHELSTHTHQHSHHGDARSLSAIRKLIQNSGLSAPVIHTAVRAFELLGKAEAKIHNVPVDEIHFHEVGAVDSIVDIVAASAGIHALGADKWFASTVNVGGGTIDCAHGRFPVPAPAAADLLRGVPTYSAHVQMELVTPTGAALLRVLIEEKGLIFGPQPAMAVETIGYGAGSRDPHGFPNVLRLSVGRLSPSSNGVQDYPGESESQTVTVLEAALDDLSPQVLAHVAELAMQRGALDVMLTPVIMKKGRPGTLITILCNADGCATLERLLLTETTTLGVRSRVDKRSCLDRTFTAVETPYGQIKIKIGQLANETLNANPEFEDCRAAAAIHRVPVKQVQQAAIAAYFALSANTPHHG
jgi:uncharacterized protein (TIGR00299 family) protein